MALAQGHRARKGGDMYYVQYLGTNRMTIRCGHRHRTYSGAERCYRHHLAMSSPTRIEIVDATPEGLEREQAEAEHERLLRERDEREREAAEPTLTPARCVQVGDLLSPDGSEYVIDVLPGPGNCVRIVTNQTTRTKGEWTPECGLHYGPYVEHRDSRLWTYGTR